MNPGDITIAHRVNAERLAILGWGRAILMQLAHPLIAAGVAGHSAFSACPLTAATRLRHTVDAMLSLTFGDDDAYGRTIKLIRGIHRRVNGTLAAAVGPYPAGTRYSAEDPDLVLWVHATLLESIILTYDDLVSPLDEAARDAYCLQARRVPLALGARDGDVPHTWNGLTGWLDATRGSGAIVVSPDAKRLAGAVLAPPMGSIVWPAVWIHRTIAVGMLPGDIRAQYDLPWTGRDARHLIRARRIVRSVRRRTPRALAWWAVARQPARPAAAALASQEHKA